MVTGRATCSLRSGSKLPGKLNKRQRELLQELDGMTQVENKPQRRTLLGKVKDIFG